jgi:hypothetical protein
MYQKIRPRSVKRLKQEREYAKLRRIYLFNYPICQFSECLSNATEVHHKKGRIGDLLTDEKYFIGLCKFHHDWVESHPIEAKEHGYSLTRTA